MRSRLIHYFFILFIVYASFFGGVVENSPLLKIAHQLASAFLIGGWLFSLVLRRRAFPITRLNGPLWALGIGWCIAAMLGHNSRVSFEFVWVTFFHIMLFFIFVDLMQNKHTLWLFEGLFIAGATVVILGLFEMFAWYFGLPPISQPAQGWPAIGGYTIPPVIHELSVPLNHKNPTGAYAVVLIPLVLAGSSTVNKADLRWGLRTLAAGLVTVVLFTQSRGAYLGLVTVVGATGVLWLLRPEIRAKFPRPIRPLIGPRVVLVTVAACGIAAVFVLYRVIVEPVHPDPDDVTRLSLWYSAIRIFKHYPLLGAGPFQFKALQLSYGVWDHTYVFLPLNHPHNLLFSILAEGGILLLAASTWLLVALAHVWWTAWQAASPPTQRRLEAALVTLLAFGVHNMVDTFLLTQLMIPMLVVAAYIVSQDEREFVPGRRMKLAARLQLPVAAATLVVGQIVFVPLERGTQYQSRFLSLYADERYSQALDAVRAAHKADRWLDLYRLEEATVLGRLAYDRPDLYLQEATRSMENAVEIQPTWDVGWHNLAALYAQAGDYAHAIDAENTAHRLSPLMDDYPLKLGEYRELAGDWPGAQEAYRDALEYQPWRARSDFWATPQRTAFLQDLIAQNAGTPLGLDLQFYSGQFARPDPATVPPGLQSQLSALWPAGSDTPCSYCYYIRDNPDLLEAEWLLQRGSLTSAERDHVESLARRAIFVEGANSSWGWYILARLDEHTGDLAQIRHDLALAVTLPPDYRSSFPGIFKMNGILEVLPQARVPTLSPIAYEPWVKLFTLDLQAGQEKEARSLAKTLLEIDPSADVSP